MIPYTFERRRGRSHRCPCPANRINGGALERFGRIPPR